MKLIIWIILFSVFFVFAGSAQGTTSIVCTENGYEFKVEYQSATFVGELEDVKFDGTIKVTSPNGDKLVYRTVIVTYDEYNEYNFQALVHSKGKWHEAVDIRFPSEDGNKAAITVKFPIVDTLIDPNFDGYSAQGFFQHTLSAQCQIH